MQCARQLIAMSSIGAIGCSLEYTTFSFFTPLRFSSQRITLASGQTDVLYIRHLKSGWVNLIARAHRADNRSACSVGVHHQRYFSRYGVNCIDYVVILCEIKLFRSIGCIERFIYIDDRIGIDLMNPFRGYIHFVFADRFSCCIYLTVNIGQADPVIVDKIHRSHAGAYKRLHSITAYTAYAEYCDTGSSQFFHCFPAKYQFGS